MAIPELPPDGAALAAAREALDCALCFRLFHEPLALACGHAFCRGCLRRALELTPACPLCRVPCYADCGEAPRNFALEAVARALFPREAAERREESAGDEEELSNQRLPLFCVAGTTHRLMPGMPLELYVFEPRYLRLVQRVLESGCLFGVVAGPGDALGAAVRLERCRRLPNGNAHVECVVRTRFRAVGAPEDEDGGLGLQCAQVRFFADATGADAQQSAPLSDAALDALAPEAARLSPRTRAALLRPRNAGGGALSEEQACSVLRDALVDFIARLGAALPRRLLDRLHSRYGQLPGAGAGVGASPERVSFVGAALFALSAEDRAAAYETTSSLRRLVICRATLERIFDGDRGASGSGDEDARDEGVGGLAPLAGLEARPDEVLDMLSGQGAGGLGAQWAAWLARSPAVQSLLVLLVALASIAVASRIPAPGYY